MPLGENPFFLPYMQAIDMLAAENSQKQAEDRAEQKQQQYEQRSEDRQIRGEERQFEMQKLGQERQAGEQEFGDLTKAIQAYPQAIEKGAAPMPDMLKSMVERRNALIGEGVTPRISGQVPEVPEKTEEKEEGVFLSPETAKFYNYDPNQQVTRVTKRTLEQARRNYFKPKDGTGDGKGEPTTPDGKALKHLENMQKLATQRIASGFQSGEWKEGVDQKVAADYKRQVQELINKFKSGNFTEADVEAAFNVTDFDVFRQRHGGKDKEGILEILKGARKDLQEID